MELSHWPFPAIDLPFALLLLVILFAGVARGLSGFGNGMIVAPVAGAIYGPKAALALIVDMRIVERGKFDEGFIRLFKPVAHHAGVVVELMHEVQVFAFQRAQLEAGVGFHGRRIIAWRVGGVLRWYDRLD